MRRGWPFPRASARIGVDGETEPVRRALQAHAERTLPRVALARTVVFSVLIVWVFANYGYAVGIEQLPILLMFIGIGLAAWSLNRDPRLIPWLPYGVVVLDVVLLTYTLFAPGRAYPDEWPWATVLRQPSFVYFVIVLALSTIWFSAPLVLWTGLWIAAALVGIGWLIATSPGATTVLPGVPEPHTPAQMLVGYLDPSYVHLDDIVVRAFVILIAAAILAYAASRARGLVYEQAELARQRANLARYVAPTMVERLSRTDRPFGAGRRSPAAVLFADIRGFTSLAEPLSPEDVLLLLRDFHGRMARLVFEHGGTLDKFIGDGLMATFGTPEPAADDLIRAFACAAAMRAETEAWSAERATLGVPPVRIGIGLHWGEVTQGDIGGANRFEFAVLGDAVNIAARLERLTRRLGSILCASGEAVAGLRAEGGKVPADLRPMGDVALRGRRGRTTVWADGALKPGSAASLDLSLAGP